MNSADRRKGYAIGGNPFFENFGEDGAVLASYVSMVC